MMLELWVAEEPAQIKAPAPILDDAEHQRMEFESKKNKYKDKL